MSSFIACSLGNDNGSVSEKEPVPRRKKPAKLVVDASVAAATTGSKLNGAGAAAVSETDNITLSGPEEEFVSNTEV